MNRGGVMKRFNHLFDEPFHPFNTFGQKIGFDPEKEYHLWFRTLPDTSKQGLTLFSFAFPDKEAYSG